MVSFDWYNQTLHNDKYSVNEAHIYIREQYISKRGHYDSICNIL